MKQIIFLSLVVCGVYQYSFSQPKNATRQSLRTNRVPLNNAFKNDNRIVHRFDTISFQRNMQTVFLVYKVYYIKSNDPQFRKGLLLMGSGNNESNPAVGSLTGSLENSLCADAARQGYVAAIVQYSAGPGIANWNASAQQLAEDYDRCVSDMASKFAIAKSKSVFGGVSYAGFLLLTANAYTSVLQYGKGILAPCSATSTDAASKFKIPVMSICCSGNHET